MHRLETGEGEEGEGAGKEKGKEGWIDDDDKKRKARSWIDDKNKKRKARSCVPWDVSELTWWETS